jgi:hypothetical protein
MAIGLGLYLNCRAFEGSDVEVRCDVRVMTSRSRSLLDVKLGYTFLVYCVILGSGLGNVTAGLYNHYVGVIIIVIREY